MLCAFLVAPFLYFQLAYTGGVTTEIILWSASDHPVVPPARMDLGRFAAFLAGFPLVMSAAAFGSACLMQAVLVLFGGGRRVCA
jgi:hypothetical protein